MNQHSFFRRLLSFTALLAAVIAVCACLLPGAARADLAAYHPASEIITDPVEPVEDSKPESAFPWVWVAAGVVAAAGAVLVIRKKK